MKSRVLLPKILFACAAGCLLTACGGGDDNNSDPQPNPSPTANQYVGRWASECVTLGSVPGGPTPADHIELRMSASSTTLPQNISMVRSSIGGPYTAQVTVEAITRNGSRYVPANGGEEFFACNVIQGIESVSLYFHDGAEEHYHEEEGPIDPRTGQPTKVKVENAYRSVTSGANAGAFTFYVAADSRAGTAVVRCSAQDPQTGKSATTEQIFTVGGSGGMPVSVRVRDSNSVDYNSSPRSPLNTMNPLSVLVGLVDETGKPAPDPLNGAANLIAEILPASTATGSALSAGGQSGQRVQVRTSNGIAQVMIQAGNVPGALVVQFTGDALDNTVSNGVSIPITQTIAVPVLDASVVADLQVLGVQPQTATVGHSYAGAVEVRGGQAGAPIGFSLVSGSLPPGLSLTPSGAITGTPTTAGSYTFTVSAAQSVNPASAGVAVSAQASVTISVGNANNSALSKLYAAAVKQVQQGQAVARSMRYEMELSQYGSGKNLLARTRSELFTDANCKNRALLEEDKEGAVMVWQNAQAVVLNGRQVQADTYLVGGNYQRWLYKEGETLWGRAAELDALGLNFVAFHRK